MLSPNRTLCVVALLISISLIAGVAFAAPPSSPSKPSGTSPTSVTVTGQHRGYTNSELFLKLDNDKEMTFLVQIPNDKEEAWHSQFKTLSRIVVTYHEVPGKKQLIATAIAKADAPSKP